MALHTGRYCLKLLLDKAWTLRYPHVVNGFNAMPPSGMWMDCSVEDYKAVIEADEHVTSKAPLTLSRYWIS